MFHSILKRRLFYKLPYNINISHFIFNKKLHVLCNPSIPLYSKKYHRIGFLSAILCTIYLDNRSYQHSIPKLYFDKVYELAPMKILGEGAFGKVMKCIHKIHKTEAAVKVILDCFDEALREKETLTYIQLIGGHNNIIKLLDYFLHDGSHYLIVEYINGNSLYDEVCKKLLDKDIVYSIINQISNIFTFMHQHGIVHCDLKPENIMVSHKSYIVKLIDFGSAIILNPQSSTPNFEQIQKLIGIPVSGTKYYWPPEMLISEDISPAMDMWSVGCILFIMLTRQHPFDPKGNRTEAQIIEAICNAPIEFTHPNWINISSDIKHIILRLLDKDKNTRMTSSELSICIKTIINK